MPFKVILEETNFINLQTEQSTVKKKTQLYNVFRAAQSFVFTQFTAYRSRGTPMQLSVQEYNNAQ